MSAKKADRKATPDDQDNLRGGTEGGGTSPAQPVSGGTNSLSPAGGSQRDRGPAAPPGGGEPSHGRGTRTDSREDAEDAFEGTRKTSPSVAKQHGRDAVEDAPSEPHTPHGAGPRRHHDIHPTGKPVPDTPH